MKIKKYNNKKILTKNCEGKFNGWLLPIYNIHDNRLSTNQRPKQVYLTVINPKKTKGPHLHKVRWGFFTCIKGNVKIIVKINKRYKTFFSGEKHNFASIQIPAGIPAALINIGHIPAYVLNMPAPAWHKDFQDDHPITFNIKSGKK